MLAVATSEGWLVLPAWQFADGAPGPTVPGFVELLRNLLPAGGDLHGTDGLLVAGWLRGTHAELDYKTPMVWLMEGQDLLALQALARRTTSRWVE